MSLMTTVLLIAGLFALAAILIWVFRSRSRGLRSPAAARRGPELTNIEFYTDIPVASEPLKSQT